MRALVEPGAELTAAELRRYSRHVVLPGLGLEGQRRLKNASVLVIGAGGLGSPVLTYLAAAGVGTIGIVDDDLVEESNLQRQVIHASSALGRAKVDSAAETIAELNPLVRVVRHQVRLDASNALTVLGDYQLVLDGTDNFATRYLVSDACEVLGLPLVWGSIFQFDGQVAVFWDRPAPVSYRDLHPQPPPPGSVPSCAEGGVLGVICAAIGSVMATEAVKLICGLGEPLIGRVLIFDALAMTWRTIGVRRPAGRAPVTALLADYQAFCRLPTAGGSGSSSGLEGGGEDSITVRELAGLLARRTAGETDFVLIDVREPEELQINGIPGAIGVPLGRLLGSSAKAVLKDAGARPGAEIPAGRRVVLYCKSGGRSTQAVALAREAGFADAVQVSGGILAWIEQIDPGQASY